MIDTTAQASRLSRKLTYSSGSFTSQDFADLGDVLTELRELRGFHWEEWGVELQFGAGTMTVEHSGEYAARNHYDQLMKEEPRRALNIDVVRRVHAQGKWIAAESDE